MSDVLKSISEEWGSVYDEVAADSVGGISPDPFPDINALSADRVVAIRTAWRTCVEAAYDSFYDAVADVLKETP